MFRSNQGRLISFVILALAGCAESGASDGENGLNALTSLAPEPAGKACPSGGTKISTGIDANGNGTLEPDEAKSSQVICNGASGANGSNGSNGTSGDAGTGSSGKSSLLNVDAEVQGNCTNGGTRIQSGLDANDNGTLEAGEITTTRYVCNGAAGSAGAKSDTVTVYNAGNVNVSGASVVTIQQLAINATGAGKIVAISNADVFCAAPAASAGYDCNGSGVTSGYLTLTTDANAAADTGSYDFFFLTPNATENASRTAVFPVAAAGNVTVYARSQRQGAGQYAFYRSSLTLIFIPN